MPPKVNIVRCARSSRILSVLRGQPSLRWMVAVALVAAFISGSLFIGDSRHLYAAESQPTDTPPEAPQFSQDAGFYTDPFHLTLTSSQQNVEILYTLDGSEPLPENIGGRTYQYKQNYPFAPGAQPGPFLNGEVETFRYTSPIPIFDRSAEPDRLTGRSSTYHANPSAYTPYTPVFKGTVIRARAAVNSTQLSPVVTRSYFVTPEGSARYSLPVISLAISEADLYDYDRGTYVAGRDFDEWRIANPTHEAGFESAANYGRRGSEWEHPLHFELFDGANGLVFSQNLGFRIHGEFSRILPQKALRLYASSEYDDASRMDFDFFPGLTTSGSNEPLVSFKRLLLRNGGNDNVGPRLRDAFVQQLVEPVGLDQQAYRPALEFINGEYWGLVEVRERIDDYFIASHHGIDNDSVAILSNDAIVEEGGDEDAADFVALRDFIATHDMSLTENYAWAAERMDMQNYALYNAIHIYVRTLDWPHNNMRVWRMQNPPQERTLQANDGRWRWILVDFDSAFGFPTEQYGFDMLEWATRDAGDQDWSTVMLRGLLKSPAFRNDFISASEELMNTLFHPAHADKLLRQMHARLQPEYAEHRHRWPNTLYTTIWGMQEFAEQRPSFVRSHISSYFTIGEAVPLNFIVNALAGGELQVDNVTLSRLTPGATAREGTLRWQGYYFPDDTVQVTATPKAGFYFAGWWELPDERSETIQIDPAEYTTLTALFLPNPETLTHHAWLPMLAAQ